MNWTNIRLIVQRETRDQLRDRRTMFTIVVLPLLLYPLLGTTFLQMAQFLQEHPSRVLVIGAERLPDEPPLLEGDRFAQYGDPGEDPGRLVQIDVRPPRAAGPGEAEAAAEAPRLIDGGQYDAVVYFPDEFRLDWSRPQGSPPPSPKIYFNAAKDKSRVAHERAAAALRRWREEVIRRNLQRLEAPAAVTNPFELAVRDLAPPAGRRAIVWSKILPFVALVWALTGAFYPAIDLCAGEKERGTLETLLCSPARRSEVVWGKLLTVMIFSIATALLNLASMGLTGALILRHLEAGGGVMSVGAPPLSAVLWLLAALVPAAGLFSALSLAIAAFARSSKEGQYYLLPLLMIALPLMTLPMFPAAELNLGTSLIPLTGVMLLLKALIEGEYAQALLYAPPVLGVMALCCLLAVRWAVDQFNNEAVLFRENERFGLTLWLRGLARDRQATPTFAQAMLCGVLILTLRFFAMFLAPSPKSWEAFAVSTLALQFGLIAAPAAAMALLLTRNPRRTLSLAAPSWTTLPAAVLLGVALHPVVMLLAQGIQILYPMSEATLRQLTQLSSLLADAPLPALLLVLALTPALCEELAFRGFILSGLRSGGRRRTAIAISSIFFGVTHGMLQQSLSACVLGVVLGYLAIQTGSLLPCVLFHLTHNGLTVLASQATPALLAERPWLRWILHSAGEGEVAYTAPAAAVGGLAAALLLMWFRSRAADESAEGRSPRALPQPAPATR